MSMRSRPTPKGLRPGQRPFPSVSMPLARTSPSPAESQARHNGIIVDATRFPHVRRVMEERIGPQWKGIRQVMRFPVDDDLDYGMVFEAVTLLCLFIDGLSAIFFDDAWWKAVGAPSSGERFMLTAERLLLPETALQEGRSKDCEQLYRFVRCAHAHSFAFLNAEDRNSAKRITRDPSESCPEIILHKRAYSRAELDDMEQRSREDDYRCSFLKGGQAPADQRHLDVGELFMGVSAMLHRIVQDERILKIGEERLRKGVLRS